MSLSYPRTVSTVMHGGGCMKLFPEAPELIITAAPWVPHVTILEHEDGSRSLEGPAAKTIDSIADALNFTYTVIQPPDGAWGLAQQDGSWTGMVGQVVRKVNAKVGAGKKIFAKQ
ncbi:Ionotropic glutamate receptor L-glutamate and glycine-binding domain [Trinorchestia longiramus]|nr:Ionotropic glutamate receptor L-glutamate and glycine-binding domain [Trinorchestia longiramus]